MHSMFEFRHKVFYEQLGREVPSRNGLEIDEYDERSNPAYLIVRNEGGEVKGCWRLLPTTGPYMTKDIFSDFLYGHPAPVPS